jgi:hypothetical protein
MVQNDQAAEFTGRPSRGTRQPDRTSPGRDRSPLCRLAPFGPIPVSRSLSGGLSPGTPRISVGLVSVRGDGTEISSAQVIDAADRLELVRVRLTRTHAAIAARLSDRPTQPHDLPVFCLAGPGLGNVCIFGLRMRVAPCRVLAHYSLRRRPSAEPTLTICPILRCLNSERFPNRRARRTPRIGVIRTLIDVEHRRDC